MDFEQLLQEVAAVAAVSQYHQHRHPTLKKTTSVSGKLADEGIMADAAPPSPVSSASPVPPKIGPLIAFPKPCLKRRSSAPAKSENLNPTSSSFPRKRGGSCDSLGEEDSCYSSCYGSSCGEGSSSSSDLLASSFSSRKSVSFADSVGEDLCHIKVFMKEQHELDELSWHAKMWRWQTGQTDSAAANNADHSDVASNNDWYFGDEDEDGEEGDFGRDVIYDDEDFEELELSNFGFDAIAEEDEDGDEDEDEDGSGGDRYAHMGRRLPNYPILEKEDEDEDEDGTIQMRTSTTSPSAASDVVVVPTFIAPSDLPTYPDRLRDDGLVLDSAVVSADNQIISGTVSVSSSAHPRVYAKYSTDSWATERTAAASAVGGDTFAFALDASGLGLGDDLEVAFFCEDGAKKFADDNGGANYRFICKNRPRFRPGKSLW